MAYKLYGDRLEVLRSSTKAHQSFLSISGCGLSFAPRLRPILSHTCVNDRLFVPVGVKENSLCREAGMPMKIRKPEQIVALSRQVEVALANGQTTLMQMVTVTLRGGRTTVARVRNMVLSPSFLRPI